MALSFSKIGIMARNNTERVQKTLIPLVKILQEHGVDILVDDQLTTPETTLEYCPKDQLGEFCDLVIAIGGDGTLLDAGRALTGYSTPLLGINLGRLGFLVDISPEDMRPALTQVLHGHFIKKPRLRLTAQVHYANSDSDSETFHALNECVIRNQKFSRILDFDTYMNDSFISHHRADGIVVATPTGSTAYALSGGGPVLHPELNALTLVPVCPHTLSDRPLVVDANQHIAVRISDHHQGTALFTADGRVTRRLAPGDCVYMQRAEQDLTLIHPPEYDYFHILRHKLEWGTA